MAVIDFCKTIAIQISPCRGFFLSSSFLRSWWTLSVKVSIHFFVGKFREFGIRSDQYPSDHNYFLKFSSPLSRHNLNPLIANNDWHHILSWSIIAKTNIKTKGIGILSFKRVALDCWTNYKYQYKLQMNFVGTKLSLNAMIKKWRRSFDYDLRLWLKMEYFLVGDRLWHSEFWIHDKSNFYQFVLSSQ